LNKALVMELARCEYVERRRNIIALGNSDRQEPHALGLASRLPERTVSRPCTAARPSCTSSWKPDGKRLLRLHASWSPTSCWSIDDGRYVPLSQTGAELPV